MASWDQANPTKPSIPPTWFAPMSVTLRLAEARNLQRAFIYFQDLTQGLFLYWGTREWEISVSHLFTLLVKDSPDPEVQCNLNLCFSLFTTLNVFQAAVSWLFICPSQQAGLVTRSFLEWKLGEREVWHEPKLVCCRTVLVIGSLGATWTMLAFAKTLDMYTRWLCWW